MLSFISLLTGCLTPAMRIYNFNYVFSQWNAMYFSTDTCTIYDIGQNYSFLKSHSINFRVISIIYHVYRWKKNFSNTFVLNTFLLNLHSVYSIVGQLHLCIILLLVLSYITLCNIFRVSQKLLWGSKVMKIHSHIFSVLYLSHRLFMI